MSSHPSSAAAAASVYAQSSIENAPPVKIVRFLYQGAIRFIDSASACEPHARASRFNEWLSRAEDVVVELRMCLDASHAPEISESLTELYLFVENSINRARREQSPEALAGARAVLLKLLEAWTAIDTSKS
ncbi:MAG: flagellar export chaperone FliS [Planctomycetota bacterium]